MGLTFSHSALDRPAVILPVALLLLAAAGGVMWSNLIVREDVRSAPVPAAASIMTPVLVAASDIPRGRILGPQDVSIQMLASAKAPAAALRRAEDAQGRMMLVPLAAGEPILSNQVSAEAVAGLSGRVPQSYRAYSVPVSEADIAGGFVQANDRVDLYLTLPSALFAENQDQKTGDRSKATLLLQNALVLAVGVKLKNDGSPTPGVRTVTLALSADDLAKVALAARLGTISFAIRNPLDDAAGPVSNAELSNLMGEASPKAPELASRKTSAGKSSAGIPFYAGRERSTLHLP
jgi:pilus assembly protein CpaB